MTDERRAADVARFVETFAAAFVEASVPRMPARVFAQLVVTDSGRLTAAELAEQLLASPAAISGAVRYLIQVGLISRVREPGSRRDHYVVQDDLWYRATVSRDDLLARWAMITLDGMRVVGRQTPAGQRLVESWAFFEFVRKELPALTERWEEQKDRLMAAAQQDPAAEGR